MKYFKKPYIPIYLIISLISFAAYFLLLHDNFLNTSISAIIHSAHNLALEKRILVLALLPIYIAAVIFGAAWLEVYLVKRLRNTLSMRRKGKKRAANSRQLNN